MSAFTTSFITTVYRQQKNHFDSNDPRESIPDRIVSTSKPYVRPIVRGKEVKSRNSPSTPLMRAQARTLYQDAKLTSMRPRLKELNDYP